MMVDPSAADQYLIEFPKSIRHKRDALVGLGSDGTTGEARLRSGEALPFDYAVLALGSSYAPFKPGDAPLSKGQRKAAFQALHERLEAAGSVLVVGGGYVGVELAAQVACHFRGRRKHLTLLAGPVPRLLPRMEPRAGEYALNFLQQQGVEVVLGESITDWGGLSADVPAASSVTLRTDRGRRLQADLAIRAVGPRPATAVLAGSLAPEQLAPSGAVRVGPTLQVAGLPNVLAIGDCADLPREATANFADIEGAVAAHNIKALAARRSGGSGKRPRLQTYPVGLLGGRAPYVGGCALGPWAGVFQLGDRVDTGRGPAATRAVLDQLVGWYVADRWPLSQAFPALKRLVIGVLGRAAQRQERQAAGAASAATT